MIVFSILLFYCLLLCLLLVMETIMTDINLNKFEVFNPQNHWTFFDLYDFYQFLSTLRKSSYDVNLFFSFYHWKKFVTQNRDSLCTEILHYQEWHILLNNILDLIDTHLSNF